MQSNMVADVDAQLEEYADLDAKIDAFELEQAKAGVNDSELPFSLSNDRRNCSKLRDRAERASPAPPPPCKAN